MMALKSRRILFAFSLLTFSTCLATSGFCQSGIASVYSGEPTANGEYAHAHDMTAAHRSLPFGTLVKVTNNDTGRSVVVRINDRGVLACTSGRFPAHVRAIEIGAGILVICGFALASCALPIML